MSGGFVRGRLIGVLVAALVAPAMYVGSAAAKEEKDTPEDEIRYRQSVMIVIGRVRADLNAMAKGDVPFDAVAAQKNAAFMGMLAAQTMRGYGPGTEKGAPTKADLKIWKEFPKYKAANDKMIAEIGRLPAASKDKGELKELLGVMGKTCKACHDTYKLVEFRN